MNSQLSCVPTATTNYSSHIHICPYYQVAVQLERQTYLQRRAAMEERDLRTMDDRIPSGNTRPVLTRSERDRSKVSMCCAWIICCVRVVLDNILAMMCVLKTIDCLFPLFAFSD